MVKFEQKEYAIPAAFLATAGKIGMGALNAAGTVGTLGSLSQGAEANEQAEEANRLQRIQSYKDEANAKMNAEATNNLANAIKGSETTPPKTTPPISPMPSATTQPPLINHAPKIGNTIKPSTPISKKFSNTPGFREKIFGIEQTNIKFRQKDFGVISNLGKKWYNSGVGKATTGIGKIAGDMLYDHRNKIIGGTLAGAGMAAVHYGVNKGIQHNMQKNGIDMAAIRDMQKEDQQQYPQQQMYADVQQQAPTQPQFKYDKNIHKRLVDQDTFGNPTHYKYVMKDASGKATENVVFRQRMTRGQVAGHMLKEHAVGPMSLGMSAVFEAPSVIEYSQDKNNLKALSDMARARKGLTPLPVKKVSTGTQQPVMNQQPQQQKSYSAVGKWLGNKWSTLSTNFKNWKKAPGENTLNWLDKGMLGGGQGKAGVTRFGDRFINYGKQNNSQFLQKTGEWIKNHPKTVMGASIAASTYTMGKTMGIGENLINKPMRAIDPNAYAYDDYKEQQIQ